MVMSFHTYVSGRYICIGFSITKVPFNVNPKLKLSDRFFEEDWKMANVGKATSHTLWTLDKVARHLNKQWVKHVATMAELGASFLIFFLSYMIRLKGLVDCTEKT